MRLPSYFTFPVHNIELFTADCKTFRNIFSALSSSFDRWFKKAALSKQMTSSLSSAFFNIRVRWIRFEWWSDMPSDHQLSHCDELTSSFSFRWAVVSGMLTGWQVMTNVISRQTARYVASSRPGCTLVSITDHWIMIPVEWNCRHGDGTRMATAIMTSIRRVLRRMKEKKFWKLSSDALHCFKTILKVFVVTYRR